MKKRAIETALAKKRAEVAKKKDEVAKNTALILSVPEIKTAHEKYVNAAFKNALGGFEKEEKAAKDAYIKALKDHGYDESDMTYTPACPICKDTGNAGGKLCKCVWDEYILALKEICDIDACAPFAFSDADFDGIKNENLRRELEKLYEYFKLYAQKLPNTKAKIITLCGGTGTGKTSLASAVAREAVERGKSVKFVSAYGFDTAMLNSHTSPTDEKLGRISDYLTADLLVIDDLGTEPILKNVTEPYLLLVLEERENKGLCTLITTNLSPARILNRYGERVYSRLASKQNSRIFKIDGKDLRLN
ncbi:MAG: ATP-binding protein [Clostridia bacterium]|nr:ATP-binding protein [Clostridia bacterium]